MARFQMRIEGMPRQIRRVDASRQAILRAEAMALTDLGLLVLRGAKLRLKSPTSGLRKGTGRLSRSIFLKVEARLHRARIGVHASVPYGRIQERGGVTRPHIIRPRVKKALAWPTGRAAAIYKLSRFHGRTAKQSQARARRAHGGEFAFARMVRHPGSVIRGQFFLQRALEEDARPEAVPTFRRRLREAMERSA